MNKEILVEMGSIPFETLEAWANRSERFVKLMSDEKIFWEACAEAQEQVKQQLKGSMIREEEIEELAQEVFKETLRKNVMIIYGRAAVQAFFHYKTWEEIEKETVSNPEWVQSAVNQSKEWCVESAIRFFRYMMVQIPSIVVQIYNPNLKDRNVNKNEEKPEDNGDNKCP